MKLHAKENLSILTDIAAGFFSMFPFRKLTLVDKRQESGDVMTFVFRPAHPFRYEAGQYGLWFYPRFIKGKPVRFFSFASSPSEETIQFSTHVSDSDYKQKLQQLKVGDTAYVKGPIGRFTIRNKMKEAVFVVGGIGVVAARSIVKDVRERQLPVSTTVIHSASDFFLYQSDIKKYADDAYFVNRQEFKEAIASVVRDKGTEAVYYAAGPPAFVDAAERELRRYGVRKVIRDGFLGY